MKNELVNRPVYLDWLNRWKDRDVIKVATGLRRCGKSSVLELFRRQLREGGIADSNILSINFESWDEEYPLDARELYRYIVQRLGSGTNYVFLDEVQHVGEFERVVDALYVREDVDLYIMGSTREETGGAGAMVGTCTIDPDFCVAVDVTHGATPDSGKGRAYDLGGGPAVAIGPNMTRWMTRRMLDKAQDLDIPVQKEVMGGDTGTNAWGMQICNEGIATAVLSLPLRYMHTPVEVVDLADLEQTAQLLAAFTRKLGEEGAQV